MCKYGRNLEQCWTKEGGGGGRWMRGQRPTPSSLTYIRTIQSDRLLDLLRDSIRIGRGEIDLVQYRYNFEVVLQCQIYVRERLRW